jgi:hypothetical protein
MIPAEEGLHERSTDWSVCLNSALSRFSGSVERLPWLAADGPLTHLNEYITVEYHCAVRRARKPSRQIRSSRQVPISLPCSVLSVS